VEGKKYWKKDHVRWLNEIYKALQLDVAMMQILFNLLDQPEGEEIPFQDSSSILSSKDLENSFAEALLSIGFSVKRAELLSDGIPTINYISIIRPVEMPVHKLLEIILDAIEKASK
jgi:hypothetical protein